MLVAILQTGSSVSWDFLNGGAFKKTDCFETREGIYLVMPSVTKKLMTTVQLARRN